MDSRINALMQIIGLYITDPTQLDNKSQHYFDTILDIAEFIHENGNISMQVLSIQDNKKQTEHENTVCTWPHAQNVLSSSTDLYALENKTEPVPSDYSVNTDSTDITSTYTHYLFFDKEDAKRLPVVFREEIERGRFNVCVVESISSHSTHEFHLNFRYKEYEVHLISLDLNDIREKFISTLENYDTDNVPNTFHEFAMYYFEEYRSKKVAPETYKKDMSRYMNHIQPAFGSMPLRSITTRMCQEFVDRLDEQGKNKTAVESLSILRQILNGAVDHHLIGRNPVSTVAFTKAESQHGNALTRADEKRLLNESEGTPYHLMFAVALYTGMRPCEFKYAEIHDGFIITLNRKNKKNTKETKKIPITAMLAPYLKGVNKLHFYGTNRMEERIRLLIPGHKLYDLRTTFYTRCMEMGVNEKALKAAFGHSLGQTADIYTDFSDEFMTESFKCFHYTYDSV